MAGWALNGPIPTDVEDALRMLFTATGGAEGIGDTPDLRVLPLAPAGQGVRVTTGTALIRSRYGSATNQSYQGALTTERAITTTQTPSNKGRSDLIVMRVEDPYAANSSWPLPADPDTYDGFPIRVIEGVPAGTTRLQDISTYRNHTAVTLARIDIPAGTATITAGMIKDLRMLALPQRSEVVFARPRVAGDDGAQMYLTATVADGGEYFPGGAGFANQFEVEIPESATRMVIDASWMSVSQIGTPHGQFWMEFGTEWRDHTWPGKRQWEFCTQYFSFNAANTADEKVSAWSLMDEVPVPAKLRGKRVTFVFKAGNTSKFAAQHKTWMGGLGGLGCRITFAQVAQGADLI